MLIKSYFKQNETTRERYTVYKLCESYRLNRSIHHRIIIGFNRLEELEAVEQKKLLAARIEDMLIKDKRDQPIELLKVSAASDDDQYLWVRSHAKVFKEHSMNGLFAGGQSTIKRMALPRHICTWKFFNVFLNVTI